MNRAFVWTSKKKSLKDKIELKLFKKFWDILSWAKTFVMLAECCWWWRKKGQRVKKSPRIHPPGTINAHTVHNNANGVGCLHGPRDIAILGLHYEEFCKWVTWQCSAVTPEGTSFNLTTSVTSKQTVPNVIVRHLRGAVQLLHQRPRRGRGKPEGRCVTGTPLLPRHPSPSVGRCHLIALLLLPSASSSFHLTLAHVQTLMRTGSCRFSADVASPPPPPNHKAEAG